MTTSDLIPGASVRFSLSGADPHEEVHVARSLTGPGAGPCFGTLDGFCFDLGAPSLQASGIADDFGRVEITQVLPAHLPIGTPVWFQAVAPRGATGLSWIGSSVVSATIAEHGTCDNYSLGSESIVSVTDLMFEVAAADFDGDGFEDVVVPLYVADTLAIYLGDGSGGLTYDGMWGAVEQPTVVQTADMDSNGTEDIVAFGIRDDLLVLLNDGAGAFFETNHAHQPTWTAVLAVGDLDGDGAPDVVASGIDGEVQAWWNDGSGDLSVAGTTWFVHYPSSMEVGDVDEDGHADLAIGHGTGVTIYPGLGDGTFGASALYDRSTQCGGLLMDDLDGDGHLDLVATDPYALNVYLGDGRGGFSSSTRQPMSGPGWVKGVDMDEDGLQDLIVLEAHTSTAMIFRNEGAGSFVLQDELASSGLSAAVGAQLDLAPGRELIMATDDYEIRVAHGECL